MACFIVPAAEAVVATVVEKAVENKEKKEQYFLHSSMYGMVK